jgi:hypothetical protein
VNLLSAQQKIDSIKEELRLLKRNFEKWDDDEIDTETLLQNLGNSVEIICQDAEDLFMDFPVFTCTAEADDFLHEKTLTNFWEKYERERSYRKIRRRLGDFIDATGKMLENISTATKSTSDFLKEQTDELPPELNIDFNIARDLFSVEMDEAGAFFAGRGLERVLRVLAKNLKIEVQLKNGTTPLHEMDFADIGEALRRARWKKSGDPVIDRELKSLIDLLRTARNAGGHPKQNRQKSSLKRNWREIANLSASVAADVWHESSAGRGKLMSLTLQRDW